MVPGLRDYREPVHIFVVSMTLRNDAGDLLIVRKRGTSVFMLPGGKVEPGETHVDAIVREVAEEVGLTLDPDAVTLLGTWTAPAANEPGWTITSDVFASPWAGRPRAAAEIEEVRWLAPAATDAGVPVAPLLTEHVLPALRRADAARSPRP
ncbi:MAG: NUDIX domain-containing protein [Propionibacteriaceae bacterium]|nr:NUDIX domain-containing protein [Propionibacteriaceae bacterium]